MAFILSKAAEEVTGKPLVPYVKEKIVESGFSIILVKWLPWGGVLMQSFGIYKEVWYGLTYSGGATWLVKKIIYWCFPQTQGVVITARCLSFISGLVASVYSTGTPTLPLLLAGTLASLRSLLRD